MVTAFLAFTLTIVLIFFGYMRVHSSHAHDALVVDAQRRASNVAALFGESLTHLQKSTRGIVDLIRRHYLADLRRRVADPASHMHHDGHFSEMLKNMPMRPEVYIARLDGSAVRVAAGFADSPRRHASSPHHHGQTAGPDRHNNEHHAHSHARTTPREPKVRPKHATSRLDATRHKPQLAAAIGTHIRRHKSARSSSMWIEPPAKIDDRHHVLLSAAIRNANGKLLAVVVAKFELGALARLARTAEIGPSGRIGVMRFDGTPVFWFGVPASFGGNRRYAVYRNIADEGYAVAHDFRPSSTFIAAAGVSLKDVKRQQLVSDRRDALIFLAFIGILALLCAAIFFQIVRPLQRVHGRILRVQAGDYGVPVRKPSGLREIREVMAATEALTDSAKEHAQNLNTLVAEQTAELKAANRRLTEARDQAEAADKTKSHLIVEMGQAQARAEKASSLLQATINNMDQGCLAFDKHLRILGANERAAECLMVPSELVTPGQNFSAIIELAAERGDYGPGDPKELVRERLKMARSAEFHRFERNQPDGSILEMRAQPLPEGGFVITYTDVTELKSLERRVRDSEVRYSLAVAGSRSGIWDWDVATDTAQVSPRCCEILDIATLDIVNTSAWWSEVIHPDDVDIYRTAVRAHLKGETDYFECEYRIRTRAGTFRWIDVRGCAVRDDQGRSYRMAGSIDDITDRKHAENALKAMATTDSLTGAFNRRKFLDLATTELYRAQRYNTPLSVALFDLDEFKLLNDTYGHAAGDKCLKSFVNLVSALVRQSDVMARYGGEEFVLLMPQTEIGAAHRLCERIREKAEALELEHEGERFTLTVSGGVDCFRPGDKLEKLLSRVDQALYRAKEEGRNRIVIDDSSADLVIV